jgi:hypothetical protein
MSHPVGARPKEIGCTTSGSSTLGCSAFGPLGRCLALFEISRTLKSLKSEIWKANMNDNMFELLGAGYTWSNCKQPCPYTSSNVNAWLDDPKINSNLQVEETQKETYGTTIYVSWLMFNPLVFKILKSWVAVWQALVLGLFALLRMRLVDPIMTSLGDVFWSRIMGQIMVSDGGG